MAVITNPESKKNKHFLNCWMPVKRILISLINYPMMKTSTFLPIAIFIMAAA